jgi:hypothetical protein
MKVMFINDVSLCCDKCKHAFIRHNYVYGAIKMCTQLCRMEKVISFNAYTSSRQLGQLRVWHCRWQSGQESFTV